MESPVEISKETIDKIVSELRQHRGAFAKIAEKANVVPSYVSLIFGHKARITTANIHVITIAQQILEEAKEKSAKVAAEIEKNA